MLVHLEIVLLLAQHRCTVRNECTIELEIILGTPDELLGDVSEVEAHLGPFGDSVNLGAR
jgi:hypothetical protein